MSEYRLTMSETLTTRLMPPLVILICIGTGILLPKLNQSSALIVSGTILALGLVAAVFVRADIRALTSLIIMLGFTTLGMTGVRVSSSLALSDVFFLLASMLILLSVLFGAHISVNFSKGKSLLLGLCLLAFGTLVASVFGQNPSVSIGSWIKLAVAVIVIPVVLFSMGSQCKTVEYFDTMLRCFGYRQCHRGCIDRPAR